MDAQDEESIRMAIEVKYPSPEDTIAFEMPVAASIICLNAIVALGQNLEGERERMALNAAANMVFAPFKEMGFEPKAFMEHYLSESGGDEEN